MQSFFSRVLIAIGRGKGCRDNLICIGLISPMFTYFSMPLGLGTWLFTPWGSLSMPIGNRCAVCWRRTQEPLWSCYAETPRQPSNSVYQALPLPISARPSSLDLASGAPIFAPTSPLLGRVWTFRFKLPCCLNLSTYSANLLSLWTVNYVSSGTGESDVLIGHASATDRMIHVSQGGVGVAVGLRCIY